VYAHPFLLESEPSAASTTAQGVERIVIYFSEAVDVGFSNIKVLDGNGNQIDNKDTSYYKGETSLFVTTPPLEDGVYTVTTKVLSKIDGHLVDYALIFGVGDVKVDTSLLDQQTKSESIFIPESLARFPGLVGQTIVLGAVIFGIIIWKNLQKKKILESNLLQIQSRFEDRFSTIIAVGLASVFASNLAMMAIQMWRLETGILEVVQTTFGTTWAVRMGITVSLLGTWFFFEKFKCNSHKKNVILLLLSLILIGTTTMMGHGAASEQYYATILDYTHNLLSAIWIGGIVFFAFVLIPTFKILPKDVIEKSILLIIPKFSTIFVLALGILLITGPTLLWFLESNVNSLAVSSYGFLLFGKIITGLIMIGIGGYNQFKIFKEGEKNIQSSNINVYNKIKQTLKIESMLGIVLLLFVAFLTNTGLPAGEIQLSDAHAQSQEFRTKSFSEKIKFDIIIDPFSSGKNQLFITISDLEGNPVYDMKNLKVKISNPIRNISPIEIPMTFTGSDTVQSFEGELTFGFSGMWMIEAELQRLENNNENIVMSLFVKPHLENIQTKITEYDFPEEATPLFPIYDKKGNLWISDPLESRIWKYDIKLNQFNQFTFDGITSIVLTLDNDGNVWFTDIPKSTIGKFDVNTEKFQLYNLPVLEPIDENPIAISLLADEENNIWIAITNKNTILKLDQKTEKFVAYVLPTADSGPFALLLGPDGNIWYSGTISGKIGTIDVKTEKIREFVPNQPLQGPEFMILDKDNNIWIAEHTGKAITKFNLIFETFEKIIVPNEESLPFGMIFDRYENLWIAQHVADTVAIFDPISEEFKEIDIPSKESFTQFLTTDDEGNLWMVEQQTNKLGKIELSEIPNSVELNGNEINNVFNIKYAYLVGVTFTVGIVLTSMLFVKSVNDKRRMDEKII